MREGDELLKKLLMRLRARPIDPAYPAARRMMLAALALGALLGVLAARYLLDPTALELPSVAAPTAIEALAIAKWPLAAALCAFAVFGAAAEPLIVCARGFLLAFAIASLSRAFGVAGFAFAMAASAAKLVLELPTLLRFAAMGFSASRALVSALGGRGKAVYSADFFLRFASGLLPLGAGVLVEMWLTPWLARLALGLIG